MADREIRHRQRLVEKLIRLGPRQLRERGVLRHGRLLSGRLDIVVEVVRHFQSFLVLYLLECDLKNLLHEAAVASNPTSCDVPCAHLLLGHLVVVALLERPFFDEVFLAATHSCLEGVEMLIALFRRLPVNDALS